MQNLCKRGGFAAALAVALLGGFACFAELVAPVGFVGFVGFDNGFADFVESAADFVGFAVGFADFAVDSSDFACCCKQNLHQTFHSTLCRQRVCP